MTSQQTSLYIHFPFCLKKCLYCDFNSLTDSPVAPQEYVAAVVREMELRAELLESPVAAATLYFGGGTPSLMAPALVARLIDAAHRLYGLSNDAEVTIEVNPGTASPEKLAGYRAAGVNRLSLGVQSFNDTMLRLLGRIHTGRESLDAYAAARTAGFDNIGIDLIHSLPGETPAAWRNELIRVIDLRPEHISAYGLSIEVGTPFHTMEKDGQLSLPDEDAEVAMFRDTETFLQCAGYEHYEISGFALPDYRSRHNQVYWRRGNYLGFGAAAHSFLREPAFGLRWRNILTPEDYGSAIADDSLPEEELTILTIRDAMAEFFFLGLRMQEVVDMELFCSEFGHTIEEAFPGVLKRLFAEGLIESRRGQLRLTGSGLLVANQVMLSFI